MRELPISFSAPMVREILQDRKTHTRRVRKRQRCDGVHSDGPATCVPQLLMTGEWGWDFSTGGEIHGPLECCPYGEPGTRLWVREPLRPRAGFDQAGKDREVVEYVADEATAPYGGFAREWPWKTRHISARYCPRWASRITLEVTDVRVERVQDINPADAIAEGALTSERPHYDPPLPYPVAAFKHLWDSINAKRGFGWEVNPWVWVIAFRKVDS